MKKVKHNKLVRDRIPNKLDGLGLEYKTHTAKKREYKRKLHEKLIEEVNEFVEKPCAEEMADILEVLEYLRKLHNLDLSEIKFQKESKRVNNGAFDGQIILEWVKEK